MVNAAISAKHECADKDCMEDTEINFTVNILNNLNKTIVVDNVYIKDTLYEKILAIKIERNITLEPGQGKKFKIVSAVIAPSDDYTVYYVPCFDVTVFYESGPASSTVCGENVKSLNLIPLSKVWCREDSECNSNEYCNTNSLYKCKPLQCKRNERAFNHTCAPLEEDVSQKGEGAKNFIALFIFIALVLVVILLLVLGKRKDKQ
jgi:hypothetical protein